MNENDNYQPSKSDLKTVKIREKTVKSLGILKWILSGNPVIYICPCFVYHIGETVHLSLCWTLSNHQNPILISRGFSRAKHTSQHMRFWIVLKFVCLFCLI